MVRDKYKIHIYVTHFQYKKEGEKGFGLEDITVEQFPGAGRAGVPGRRRRGAGRAPRGARGCARHRRRQVQLPGAAARRALAHQGHQDTHPGEEQRRLVARTVPGAHGLVGTRCTTCI